MNEDKPFLLGVIEGFYGRSWSHQTRLAYDCGHVSANLVGQIAKLHGELRTGEPVVWFLMLSPYLAWQLLRLTVYGFRRAGK